MVLIKIDRTKKFGEKIGYLVMYFIFTTIFYFVLKLLNKLPVNWNYFHIVGLTLIIVFTGKLIKKILE